MSAISDEPNLRYSDTRSCRALLEQRDPAGSGYAASQAWQLEQNGVIGVPSAPGGQLKVDLSSAVSPNPSAPVAVV